MDLEKLKSFIQLAKDEGVTSLAYESDDEKYKVQFGSSGTVVAQPVTQAPQPSVTSAPSPTATTAVDSNIKEITSPFVGTFYSSSAPGKPVYAKVGDHISPGQVLCILEAMKIMNEIESDISGEIVEICVENESLVEFGQVLFKVKG